MKIKKFSNFDVINELKTISTIDVMIDDQGKVHNGNFTVNGQLLTLKKGNIQQVSKSGKYTLIGILGSDRINYPAGIDKNGKLVSVNQKDGIAYNSTNDRPLEMPQELQNKFGPVWRIWKDDIKDLSKLEYTDYIDYSSLVPIVPTGWVNVKIDMEVLKRVKRYSSPLGNNQGGHQSLLSKLAAIQRISRGVYLRPNRTRETIQKDMSAIILLHYINEIKDFFTAGSSGFLFESFIAGLIPNGKVIDDNSEADIRADNVTYQIKLYNNVAGNVPLSNKRVNYYLIGIKHADKIVLYIFTSDPRTPNYIHNFTTSSGISMSQVRNGNVENYEIDLLDIEGKIRSIAVGLKESLDELYGELSSFQYNIETIISGVNQEGKILSPNEFKIIVDDSKSNVTNMRSHLDSLILSVKYEVS
jgi:hypothetical protein